MTPIDPVPCPCAALWGGDLPAPAPGQSRWLWQGYLAPGSVTLLTSQWKAGKTTLLAILLARLGSGGALAGQPLTAGKAVVVSEESTTHWQRRGTKLDFGRHVCWLCRPFRGKPTVAEWHGLLDRLVELRREHGLDLAVIDPLAVFLPGRSENAAGPMLEALAPLQRLTALDMAVLLLHHPRKGSAVEGQMARGSGALSGHVDILIEMQPGRSPGDRCRRLRAYSRFEETPESLVIELNEAGTDYESRGDFEADEFVRGWVVLRPIFADAARKLTRGDVLAAWPPEAEKPSAVTLWRWLERATAAGLLNRDGKGTKREPFGYWLQGQEEKWQRDPYGILDMGPFDPFRPR